MALVNYSDSETSDTEEAPAAPAATVSKTSTTSSTKPAFQKSTESRKIKVDLPSLQPETSSKDDEPPAKKARTAGAFSGFNSLLPAPKRAAAQNVPKAGVSLKTSSEAAFSRNYAPSSTGDGEDVEQGLGNEDGVLGGVKDAEGEKVNGVSEVKVVGKATKFKPLSVGNKKKPAVKKAKSEEERPASVHEKVTPPVVLQKEETVVNEVEPPPSKPKRSLFSVPQQDERDETPTATETASYEAITTTQPSVQSEDRTSTPPSQPQPQPPPNSNTLQSLASDLNLTAAQKRQLFGRNAANNADINIAHFNMDSEYAANEQLRQAGEVVEHRAVKAIAPGKHSLQQLVNNAKTQQDAMEDKWAQGRRERGEGGSKYGWGR